MKVSGRSIKRKLLQWARRLDDRFYEGHGRVRVLWVLSDGYGFACQAPVLQALEARGGFLLGTTTDRPRDVDGIEFNNASEKDLFRRHYRSPRHAALEKWHYVINTHLNAFYPKRNALRVFMHHGPGFGITGDKVYIVRKHDLFFGLSRVERAYFEELEPDLFGTGHAFFSVGFPKSDAWVRHPPERRRKLAELGLPDRPTLLITSHWWEGATLRDLEERPLRRLAKAFPRHNIIQTGHPWLWGQAADHGMDRSWQEALKEKLQGVVEAFPNAYFLPNTVVEPLLSLADLLVADQSSVITTYSLLDRPIVFFDNPETTFFKPEVRELYRHASHCFADIGQLVQCCQTALRYPEKKTAGRAAMRASFYTEPGHSKDIAANLLTEFGRVCSTRSRGWKRIADISQRDEHTGYPITRYLDA